MKFSFGVSIVSFLAILGIWRADVANDQEKKVKITEHVSAYNNWECGYQNQSACNVVFEVKADEMYDAQRIRYGKDFMAIKIHQGGLDGWVISGKGVQVNAEPNT